MKRPIVANFHRNIFDVICIQQNIFIDIGLDPDDHWNLVPEATLEQFAKQKRPSYCTLSACVVDSELYCMSLNPLAHNLWLIH